MPQLLGHAPIAGAHRPVYEDVNNNQFMLGRHGERVYGVFLDAEDLDAGRSMPARRNEMSRKTATRPERLKKRHVELMDAMRRDLQTLEKIIDNATA
jgi:hypothetical protein